MASSFNYPVLQFHSEEKGRTTFRLVEDYVYEWEIDGRQHRFTVPAGYLTDKASVPRFAWALGFRPDGAHEAAALIHDALYQYKGEPPPGMHQIFFSGQWQNVPNVWSRQDIDRFFGRLMREAGCPVWRRRLMYLSVRAFGWYPFHFGMP